MKRRPFLIALGSLLTSCKLALGNAVDRQLRVTLKNAHKGTLDIDTQLLDSYGPPPADRRQFYLDARKVFSENPNADFTNQAIVDAAKRHRLHLMGGPMLGDLHSDSVSIWLRPATTQTCSIAIDGKTFDGQVDQAGEALRIPITGLAPNTGYEYQLRVGDQMTAEGSFTTAPLNNATDTVRIAFGSCCHKIGVHNLNLFRQIVGRHPHAMMLLGDIAVDDREGNIAMHRADYQLRDVSNAWRELSSQVPLYASWDDHDYFNNDLSGVPKRFTAADRDGVRSVWHENWNNPPANDQRDGIYFNTRIGPIEIIMLDTRSCRQNSRRNRYGSYLGEAQQAWLKNTLQNSNAPFKIISSGTMWSDYVSNAKDSWGSWDTEAREEIFQLIEQEKLSGVLLVCGDRHGARGFRIPRPSGFAFYEFEPATLGGVSGPAGLVKDCPDQLFGYSGTDDKGNDFIAFGEFTFDMAADDPTVTFRLIGQHGDVLEEIPLALSDLTPA
ncbi:alkaline phosphatase D family protein [Crateriforma conspicua]|uniref:alkaline phosphatase D family protein n=1 Tax=Crateriforma conspicua TaxID=2527996 RepID=UPI001188202D|nr:alkaline phosphatase D family protein [Crateriforma conspicua]QDV64583.1 Alkaline phosphatase D precursor [Crateriforma conspicua]